MRGASFRAGSLALLIAIGAGCAGGSSQAAQGATANPARYTLTAVELQGAGVTNLYDAIQKLRPEFLRTRGSQTIARMPAPQSNRGPTSGGSGSSGQSSRTAQAVPIEAVPLKVYENDILLDSPTDLRKIDTKNVIEVRFVPGPEAGVRYGMNHSGGVIFVKTT